MGARTTWEIRGYEGSPSIYLYSHWGGDSKWSDTQSALSMAEPRWSDPSYASRIFISQIVGRNWDSETGFGIAAGKRGEAPFEESYFPVVVDFGTKLIEVTGETYTFNEFLALEDKSEEIVELFWSGAIS